MHSRNKEASNRAEIRGAIAENIRALDERIEAARAAGLEDERLQLKRLRTLGQLARQYRLLARDADVDKLEADLDTLESVIEEDRG